MNEDDIQKKQDRPSAEKHIFERHCESRLLDPIETEIQGHGIPDPCGRSIEDYNAPLGTESPWDTPWGTSPWGTSPWGTSPRSPSPYGTSPHGTPPRKTSSCGTSPDGTDATQSSTIHSSQLPLVGCEDDILIPTVGQINATFTTGQRMRSSYVSSAEQFPPDVGSSDGLGSTDDEPWNPEHVFGAQKTFCLWIKKPIICGISSESTFDLLAPGVGWLAKGSVPPWTAHCNQDVRFIISTELSANEIVQEEPPSFTEAVDLILLSILDVPFDAANEDLGYVLRQSNSFKTDTLGHGRWLMTTGSFKNWLSGGRSDILLVDGHSDEDKMGKTSPMSVFCATFVASVVKLRSTIVLHFFCGTLVFCIIDSLSEYETRMNNSTEDLRSVVDGLQSIVRDQNQAGPTIDNKRNVHSGPISEQAFFAEVSKAKASIEAARPQLQGLPWTDSNIQPAQATWDISRLRIKGASAIPELLHWATPQRVADSRWLRKVSFTSTTTIGSYATATGKLSLSISIS
ncbi:uncharacterized protein PAC_01316 [Phialocephala subalpina]|uniref:Uncharacterized protein n=1 Tax=Phialocephala subalpina TaxID=576137 RepID=A0A1L7WF90_9HELO|nr:uncharacterized protein PAC_01316 [Phialocephala subalpina]